MRTTPKNQSSIDAPGIHKLRAWATRCLETCHKPILVLFVISSFLFPGNSSPLAQTTSPRELKQQAIAELEQISTSQNYLQRIIKRAIKNVNESLEDKGRSHFLDGYRILPPPDGEKVFQEERNAVQWLLIALRLRRTPQDIKVVLSRVIDTLVEADRIIAKVSIDVAGQLVRAGVGDAEELADAQREYERALLETNPRKAIQRFQEAWEDSQEVVDGRELVIKEYHHSPTPFSPSLTSNTLRATFQIYLKKRFWKDHDRDTKNRDDDDDDDRAGKSRRGKDTQRKDKYTRDDDDDDGDDKKHLGHKQHHERREEPLILEFVEIIYDSSGAIVRAISTEYSVPFPSPGNKNRSIEFAADSVWDGKGETDEILPDGTYTYLAFGHLVKPAYDGRKKRRLSKRWWHKYLKHKTENEYDHKETIATSFPVTGSIVLDNTPPTITETVTPSPNSAGWNNSDVTVSFTCSDSSTSIVACSEPVTVSTEGANQLVTGTAEDQAGNTTTATVRINLDKTIPGINILSPTNDALLNVTEAEMNGSVIDIHSGVRSATCNSVAASISGSSFVCSLFLAERANLLEVIVTDHAGNVNTASISVNVDTFPPALSITDPTDGITVNRSPITIQGFVDDETAIVSVNEIVATLTKGDFTVSVPLLEGANTITATATDIAGNMSASNIQVFLRSDNDPPNLVVDSPTSGGFVIQNQPPFEFRYSDPSGVDTTSFALTIDGVIPPLDCELTFQGGRCVPTTDLSEGLHTLVVSVEDLLGNRATTQLEFTVDSVPVEISIAEPIDGSITKEGHIQVTGIVGPNVTNLKVNGVEATFGSPFTATVPLREGKNMIVAVATKANGKTGTDSVDVTRDLVAPIVQIDSPRNSFVSVNNTIAVTGLVNDIVNGGVDAVVRVNGIGAIVADGSFIAMDIPLTRGLNTIEAVATDSVGNVGRHSINVTYQPPVGPRISIASGNGQFESVMQPLPEPLVVAVQDDFGNPVAGRVIRFEVTRNSGTLKINDGDQPKRTVLVPTDGNGQASVLFTLGDTSGEGTNRVRASATGVAGEVEFCASGLTTSPAKILMSMGDNQRGIVGNPLPIPLEAIVLDRDGNPSKDISVIFTVVAGDGNLNGQQSIQRVTGSDGVARAALTLGPQPGINNNIVNATFPGLTGQPATFTASGLTPGDPDSTTFTGVVLDSGHTPIPGTIVTIPDTIASGITDAEGRFFLENVPVGHIHLRIDPTASPRPETFPRLEFETVTISGQKNVLGQPIIIPPIDTESSKVVGGNEDVTLTMTGVPGLELTVFANSVTCPPSAPDRSSDGTQCRVSISQVHLDKVPMPPPNGTSFMPPAWTVQPPGVHFDPPARISIPNNGLPPGRMLDLFQFDHSLFQFVNIGKGTVAEDGLVIVSDPGFGITHAGWGGGGQPPPPPTCACACNDNNSCTVDSCSSESNCACSIEFVGDGTSCNDGKFCTESDQCESGQCNGTPKPDKTQPSVTFTVNLDALFKSVKGFLKTLFGEKAPDFKLQVTGSVGSVETCCDKKMQFVLDKKVTGGVVGGVSTGDLPIPGLAIKLPFNIGEAGIFLNFGLAGTGSMTVKEDTCLDSFEGKLSGQVGGSGSLKAKLVSPGEVVDIQASGTTGLTGGIVGTVKKGEITAEFTGGHKGLVGTVSVTFLNGVLKEAINFTFIEPDGLAPVSVTIPFTT